jgi:hypothetical protein
MNPRQATVATVLHQPLIDAWWIEPVRHGEFRIDQPFLDLPNVIASPHNSAQAEGAHDISLRRAVENCRRALTGEAPLHVIVGTLRGVPVQSTGIDAGGEAEVPDQVVKQRPLLHDFPTGHVDENGIFLHARVAKPHGIDFEVLKGIEVLEKRRMGFVRKTVVPIRVPRAGNQDQNDVLQSLSYPDVHGTQEKSAHWRRLHIVGNAAAHSVVVQCCGGD